MLPGGSYRGYLEPCSLRADTLKFKGREMPKVSKSPSKAPDKSAKANQPMLHAIKGGKGAAKRPSTRHDSAKAHPAAHDDAPIIALKLEAAKLSPAMAAYFKKCQDKLGFVPNVLLAYAFDMAKLETFADMYNDLMLGDSGLSKLEREMIAVAVSSQNRCYYCLTAHGAAVRQLSGDPSLGEMMAMNFRAADLSPKQTAMLEFAVKLTEEPAKIIEADRAALRKAGFSDRDIWDIASTAAFFNMSNRVAAAVDMRPNDEYHAMAR